MTIDKLDMIITELCQIAENSIRRELGDHVRTGETLSSIQTWVLGKTENEVSYAVGSRTRGAQLYWLDQGRREVRPIRASWLRWLTFPEGIVIFSKYSRATEPLGILRRAGLDTLSQESTVIEKVRGVE